MPWCQTVWVCSLTLGGSPGSAERGRGTQTWGKASANPFPKSGLWAQGVRVFTHALSSDLEQVPTLLSGSQFPQAEICWGSGERVRSYKSLRFSASSLLSSPSSGPRQPRGMLGTRPGLWARLLGGGGGSLLPSPSSPPWPDSRPRRRVWEVGKEGRGMRAGTADPSLAPASPFPPPPPSRLSSPSSAGRYPSPGPLLQPPPPHPQLQTWLGAARGRERRKEKD